MRLALFQPDIPQNLGAAIRLGACLGVELDVIEPCGFPLDAAAIRRSAMDYGAITTVERHANWAAFQAQRPAGTRLILLTTAGANPFPEIAFRPSDTLLLGRESVGAPPEVHAAADIRLRIPMTPGARSLNIVNAAAIVLGEALRQTHGFPKPDESE